MCYWPCGCSTEILVACHWHGTTNQGSGTISRIDPDDGTYIWTKSLGSDGATGRKRRAIAAKIDDDGSIYVLWDLKEDLLSFALDELMERSMDGPACGMSKLNSSGAIQWTTTFADKADTYGMNNTSESGSPATRAANLKNVSRPLRLGTVAIVGDGVWCGTQPATDGKWIRKLNKTTGAELATLGDSDFSGWSAGAVADRWDHRFNGGTNGSLYEGHATYAHVVAGKSGHLVAGASEYSGQHIHIYTQDDGTIVDDLHGLNAITWDAKWIAGDTWILTLRTAPLITADEYLFRGDLSAGSFPASGFAHLSKWDIDGGGQATLPVDVKKIVDPTRQGSFYCQTTNTIAERFMVSYEQTAGYVLTTRSAQALGINQYDALWSDDTCVSTAQRASINAGLDPEDQYFLYFIQHYFNDPSAVPSRANLAKLVQRQYNQVETDLYWHRQNTEVTDTFLRNSATQYVCCIGDGSFTKGLFSASPDFGTTHWAVDAITLTDLDGAGSVSSDDRLFYAVDFKATS